MPLPKGVVFSCTMATVLTGLPAASLRAISRSVPFSTITPNPGPKRKVLVRPRVTILSETPTSTTWGMPCLAAAWVVEMEMPLA